MDYRSIASEELPMGLPEQEFRKEVAIRRAAHNLKTSSAFCLRAQTMERMPELPPESFFEYLRQMQAESADPQAFARRILVEQAALAKAAVEGLMIDASLSDQPEVKTESLAAAARLMAQIRKNLEVLVRLPVSAVPLKETARTVVTDDEILDRFGYETRDANASEPEKNRDTELGSNASPESEESETSRGRADKSRQTPGAHRCGPPTAAGSGFGQSSVGTIQRSENERGQAQVGSKRAARNNDVKAANRPRSETPEETARRHAEITQLLSGLVPMHIGTT